MGKFLLGYAIAFFIVTNAFGQINGIHPLKYVGELKKYEPSTIKDIKLDIYYDYDEALAASKKLNRPILLDFNAIHCMPCRKMESDVWKNEKVARILKEDFVVLSLLCDMNTISIPLKEQYYSKFLKKRVLTLGEKAQDLEHTFGCDGQPAYFFINEKGTPLATEGYLYYNPDIEQFIAYLNKITENYKKHH